MPKSWLLYSQKFFTMIKMIFMRKHELGALKYTHTHMQIHIQTNITFLNIFLLSTLSWNQTDAFPHNSISIYSFSIIIRELSLSFQMWTVVHVMYLCWITRLDSDRNGRKVYHNFLFLFLSYFYYQDLGNYKMATLIPVHPSKFIHSCLL